MIGNAATLGPAVNTLAGWRDAGLGLAPIVTPNYTGALVLCAPAELIQVSEPQILREAEPSRIGVATACMAYALGAARGPASVVKVEP